MKFVIAAIAFFAASLSVSYAQQNQAITSCSAVEEGGPSRLKCDTRFMAPAQVQDVFVNVGERQLDGVTFTGFGAGDNDKAAWLFLIDRSNPRRAGTVARNVEFIKSIAKRATDKQFIGVATFANNLTQIVALNEKNADFDRRFEAVKADGSATEFFSTALQGIKLLEQFDAKRKALVIMSDGKVEDTAYTRADVVKAARAAGIVIYGMGYAERASETPDLQVLRRLSEDTNGPFSSTVSPATMPLNFSENFFDYLSSGGTMEVAIPSDLGGELNSKITYQLAGGTELTNEETAFFAAVVEAPEPEIEEPVERSFVASVYGNIASALSLDGDSYAAWADENFGIASILLLILALLFLAPVLWFAMRQNSENESSSLENGMAVVAEDIDTPQTAILSDQTRVLADDESDGIVLGWFEMVDNPEDRFAITQNSIDIGRHSESDFQLNNDSVHRHHAHFHFDTDGKAMIADLDTVNGVKVNGGTVRMHEVQSGDMIELGEVRFRYVAV